MGECAGVGVNLKWITMYYYFSLLRRKGWILPWKRSFLTCFVLENKPKPLVSIQRYWGWSFLYSIYLFIYLNVSIYSCSSVSGVVSLVVGEVCLSMWDECWCVFSPENEHRTQSVPSDRWYAAAEGWRTPHAQYGCHPSLWEHPEGEEDLPEQDTDRWRGQGHWWVWIRDTYCFHYLCVKLPSAILTQKPFLYCS